MRSNGRLPALMPDRIGDVSAAASSPRRGAVLVMAVACIAVVSFIAITMLKGAIQIRKQWRLERISRQIESLLDAAERLGRQSVAEGRLNELTVEVDLSPASDRFARPDDASMPMVHLSFAPDAGGDCRVEATVEWPSHEPLKSAVRRSRSFVVRSDEKQRGVTSGGRE